MSDDLVAGPLGGKVAVVSGGTRGIGRAISLALGRAGARIAFCYQRDDTAAKSLEGELAALGRQAYGARVDVTDGTACQAFAAEVRQKLGDADVLVNNAGVVADRPLYAMTEDEWDLVVDTNLKGAFNLTRAFLARMMKRGGGRIVNMASVSALRGLPGQAGYAASKAGLLGFTRALAAETARFGLTVNAVAPGYVDTDMLRTIPDDKRAALVKTIPLGRLGREDDVAQAVLFLASDAAAYVTGVVLPVDGGLLL